MKTWKSALLIMLVFGLGACNSGTNSQENKTYDYVETTTELNPVLKARIGDWAKKGVECYGVVVTLDAEGVPQNGLPVKAKIIRIEKDQIKMKALENISLGEEQGCSKMGISSGETWWETDGDLFQTREEAEQFLRKKGLFDE